MHITPPRLARLLACAAVVPAMLVTSCSLGPDSKDSASGDASAPAKSSTPPTVAPAKYAKLPQPCSVIDKKMIGDLVPKTKEKSGTAGKSADLNTRGTCSWNGLDGFQYRWLDVSLQRFDSDPTLGSGDSRARSYFAKQVESVKAARGAKGLKSGTAAGIGDQATTVTYEAKKDGDTFKNQTVVARSANVVVTLNYNGAGYEDAKPPKTADMLKDARIAAEAAVAAVADGNKSAAG
ncbi:DUF3558 domain-containing protein [Streptomyces sp. KR80]|uniref:DUF3558 domain-containing protein n=1 Tax=Streptomyces sp. KR80 TaxID=3457426 RepID=UPI003FD5B04F